MSSYSYPPNFGRSIPEGDDHERAVCDTCGFISYENPKIIAGAVIEHEGKILMCRRAIEPRKGFWTIPAGFMELGETPEQGAMREAWEEARARIIIKDLLAVYTVKRISQVHLMYRAHLKGDTFAVGPESSEVKLVAWDEIMWEQLAFPSVHWILKHYQEAGDKNNFAPYTNPTGWENV